MKIVKHKKFFIFGVFGILIIAALIRSISYPLLDKDVSFGEPSPALLFRQVTIITDKTEYEEGEPVKIVIENHSSEKKRLYQYDIERFNDDDWIKIRRVLCPCGAMCRIAAYMELEPDESFEYEWDQQESWCIEQPVIEQKTISQQAPLGRYRIKSEISEGDKFQDQRTIYSDEFIIKEKSSAQKGEIIEVTGRIVSIGSDPFTQIAIEADGGTVYGLVSSSKSVSWRELPAKRVKVRGYVLGRTPPSFRTEISIDVISFEVIE